MEHQTEKPQSSSYHSPHPGIDRTQILKAARALASYLDRFKNQDTVKDKQPKLLEDGGGVGEKESPIVLVLSAKKHLMEGSLL